MTLYTTDGRAIDAVLFDLDGTLVETSNRWAEGLAKRLAPLRRLWPQLDTATLARDLVMAIEMPANYLVSSLEHLGLTGVISGIADRVRRSKGLATRGQARLIAGSEALLEALAPQVKLAVVTTRARAEAHAFVRTAELERFFPVIITRQDVWRMKPHPAPVLAAAEQLGVEAQRCLLVGDTVMDVRAAKRAGAVAVGVLTGIANRRELERADADLILDRADELLPHLSP
jgi:HAD superfamily hydrolase (TIGR01509 family)